MKTIKLVGTIKTVAPLQVTLPDVDGIPRNAQGQPYFPASSIRGWLRHATTNAIVELLQITAHKLNVDEIYMLASGVDTARKINLTGNGSVTVGANNQVRSENPFLSLFGRWQLEGKLKVGNAYPEPNQNVLSKVGGGARGHAFARNPKLIDFVDHNELDYLQEIMQADAGSAENTSDLKAQQAALKRELKTADKERKSIIFQELKALDEQIDVIKNGRVGAKESIQRPIEQFEAIDAGIILNHRMTLAEPTHDELLLLIWSLYIASLNPFLGGKAYVGCGEINAEWEVREYSFGDFQPKVLGKIIIDDDGFNFDIDGIDASEVKAIGEKIKDKTFNLTKYA